MDGLMVQMGSHPVVVVLIVLAVVAALAVMYGITAGRRNRSEQGSLEGARVDSKRIEHTTSCSGENTTATSTAYYATFALIWGGAVELRLSQREYDLLAEGDMGMLRYEDDWFYDFELIGRPAVWPLPILPSSSGRVGELNRMAGHEDEPTFVVPQIAVHEVDES